MVRSELKVRSPKEVWSVRFYPEVGSGAMPAAFDVPMLVTIGLDA
jgi:hypothetical protein